MSDKIFIYGLTGDDNVIRYIGKTSLRRLEKRRGEHISEATTLIDNRHKNNWIRKVLKNGENLNILVLEECDESIWQEREIFWISQFNNLTNRTEGGDGKSGYEYKLTLEEVMTWVKNNIPKINSESKWRDYVKNNSLPNFIPKRPDSRYKNDGWISFPHFFNYPDHKKQYISYEDLKKFIQENKINGYHKYLEIRTKNMPFNPVDFYDECNSLKDILCKKPIKFKNKKRNIISYDDAKIIIKNLNFTKKKEYTCWYSENKHLMLPINPPVYYKKEWMSWQDFFGNSLPIIINYHKHEKSTHFLPYSDAKEWINSNMSDIKTENDWRKITKTLPKFIPKRPDYVFKNNGWINYASFLS